MKTDARIFYSGRAGRSAALPAAIMLAALTGLAQSAAAGEPTLVQRLIARYEALESVSCDVLKITTIGERTVRMLSRVTYRRPDMINVEVMSPTARRIVSDGERLYYYEQDALRGFSMPLNELNEYWSAALRSIPATPMENLLRLRDCPETELPPVVGYYLRRGYAASNVYVVVSCDWQERPKRLDFFKTAEMREPTGHYEYSDFTRMGDCWLSSVQKAVVRLPDDSEMHETRRINKLMINAPVDENLFNHRGFFEGVTFTNDFRMTYVDAPSPSQ